MGNKLGSGKASLDPDVAWKLQNKQMAENPMYRFADLARGGKLIKAYEDHGPDRVKEIARTEMAPYLYNGGKGGHISKIDYLRWCEFMKAKASGTTYVEKSEEELLQNFREDKFNKFQPHDACWDLFKRGGVGETPFHLCYLMDTPVHFEVGKALMEVFPKLALDVYEGEEYFGESALHIAVILGDLEAVQLLVKNGANINQRATGRFFLPEDQKHKPVKETDYSGYCYFGEYPLAFAACRGNEELYDFLIDHGADPNAQDSFGNTVLHMLVIHEQSKLFQHAVRHPKKPARTDILNKQNLTPLTLASKLGRARIFKDMLDLGSIEFWQFSTTVCSVYPLAAIDSIAPNGETNWHSALMIIVNGETDEHLEMLEGGVIRQLLEDKWKTFARRRFIERLIIAALHLLLLSIAIYTRPSREALLAYSGVKDAVRYFAEVVVCVSCVITIIMECIEIASQGFSTFLRNCSHAPDHTVYLIACVLILACVPFRVLKLSDVEDVLLIIAAPGSWVFLLFFARVAKLTGPFVTMIYKMVVGDLFRFAIIYCIFLVGFTQGFYFLFQDVPIDKNDEDYSAVAKFFTLHETILSLFQMTLGEFKYDVFDHSRYPELTKFVFAIFMILMPILLLNMLIAMMGNTYNQVIVKSEKEWRRQWAKIVVVLERGFSKKQLQSFQMEYSVKLAGPPKHQLGEYSDPSVEQRALVVIKSTTKSRAKTIKAAIVNWKKLGREIIRQKREWRVKGVRGNFAVQKRRGTIALEDMGLPNLSGTVEQLAWEKDLFMTKGGTPRSPGDDPYASPTEDTADTTKREIKGQGHGHGQNQVANGGLGLANGSAAMQELHQQQQSLAAAATAINRRPWNLVYNRVAPLLPPLPQEDSSAQAFSQARAGRQGEGNVHTQSVCLPSSVSLDFNSISSWGGGTTTEASALEETPRLPGYISPERDPNSLVSSGTGSSQSSRLSGDVTRDVEAGRLSIRKEAPFKDVESGVGVEMATTQSGVIKASVSSPEGRHQQHDKKKKKGKDGMLSKESSPKKSPEQPSETLPSAGPDFDSQGFDSPEQGSQDQRDKDSSCTL